MSSLLVAFFVLVAGALVGAVLAVASKPNGTSLKIETIGFRVGLAFSAVALIGLIWKAVGS